MSEKIKASTSRWKTSPNTKTETLFNSFNQNDLDLFFTSISDFFVDTLKNGLANINSDCIKFKYLASQEIFNTGYNYIQSGICPDTIKALIETEILFKTKSLHLSKDEIFEMILLKDILIYIQNHDFTRFLDIQNQLCSNKLRSINETKFNSFK